MKSYNKLVLGILVMLAIMINAGCSSVVSHQDSIFDNDSKIIAQGDSHTYKSRLGNIADKETEIKFNSFSGSDTIYRIISDGESDAIFNFSSISDKGDFKVVLITADDEIINIVNGTGEGSESISIEDGTSRVKLIGKKAKGEIKLKIESGENVDIKVVD
ncbi:MAG: hypothetical protein GX783_12670 [Clostridiales bacterium]|nr:hypothetical protein [Clostridiales bacterium]